MIARTPEWTFTRTARVGPAAAQSPANRHRPGRPTAEPGPAVQPRKASAGTAAPSPLRSARQAALPRLLRGSSREREGSCSAVGLRDTWSSSATRAQRGPETRGVALVMAPPPPMPRHGWTTRRTWTAALVCVVLVGGSYGYTNPDVQIDCRKMSLECGPSDADRMAGWVRASFGTVVLAAVAILLVALILSLSRRPTRPRGWIGRHRLVAATFSATVLALTVGGSRHPSLRCPLEDGIVDCFGPPSRSDHVVAVLDAAVHSLIVAVPVGVVMILLALGLRKLRRLWNDTDAELAMLAARDRV
jgi:hypothetical protein